jgi:hypothetical protein
VAANRTHLKPILMLLFCSKLMLKFGFLNVNQLC